ncbi:hypothetical protein Y695_04850 [Hydrogenophaga sp. T4]|nr:hypothetical protein Y695_04850 [Hydrogenophaga sp. T4]
MLPAVATRMVGQNSSGLSLISANTAGSEPSGRSVAETNATRKTVLRPTSGKASVCSSETIQAGMGSG